jgi:hypothetical protein
MWKRAVGGVIVGEHSNIVRPKDDRDVGKGKISQGEARTFCLFRPEHDIKLAFVFWFKEKSHMPTTTLTLNKHENTASSVSFCVIEGHPPEFVGDTTNPSLKVPIVQNASPNLTSNLTKENWDWQEGMICHRH